MEAEVSSTTFYDESEQRNTNIRESSDSFVADDGTVANTFSKTVISTNSNTGEWIVDSNEDHQSISESANQTVLLE